ncbi:TetR family transcriptional regulator [Thermodesulfobacteriota bacterium]
MKVSQEQKVETRKKIINASVDIIIEKGIKNATMREIAKQAEIGDATIYNYFPTKESIIYGYYRDRLEVVIERLKTVEGLNEYNLQEQLQTFFETNLEIFLPDREFIQETFKVVFFSIGQSYSHLKPIRTLFYDIVDDIFQAAIEVGEIREQVFGEIIYQLFWDYYIGLVTYWLNDQSDQFTDTSLLIDKSLDLAVAFLKAGILNKFFNMASFLFKNHILSRMDFFKDQVETVHRIKREFMAGKNGL